MATHKDHGLGKADKTPDEEDHPRTRKHSGGPPESPQSHALPLSPASLSWEDEAFPISTPNTDMYAQTKGNEENTLISEEVPNLPGPSTKEGKIPGYGKFAAFLQEEEENVEDFLDEEDDDLYDPEEEEEEISSSGGGQLESSLHTQDAEEDSIPPRKVSISAEDKETTSISAQQKAEISYLQEEEEDEKHEKDIPEYSTNANKGVGIKSEERPKAVSYNEKQQGTVNVYDEKGEARITTEAPTHASMPSVYAQDQVLESSLDEKPISSCQQDEEAHVLTKQHESANILTHMRERANTQKDQKTGTDSPSRTVRNTVWPSSEQEENSSKPPEQEEPALTECIQQGESLLQRLHVVQQNQQSPEVSEEFSGVTNQSARLGNSEARERGTSLTSPDIEDSCGEEKDGDDNDAAAGPSHWQPVVPEGLEVLQVPGERVRANLVELQVSDGDDQSDSGVSADFSPCGLPEAQASAAASTAATPQLAPGTPAQRRRHLSSGQEGCSQAEGEVDDGPKGSETEQIPTLRDPLEDQSSFGAVGTVEAQKGFPRREDSVGKKMGQQMSSKVNEEDEVWIGKVMGEYSEGSVRKFKERRMLFEAFQQARPAELKPPPVRPKRIIPTSFSAFSLSSVSTRQVTEERIHPSVSVMERARSLEQLSQAQETGVPWLRDSGWGNQDERDRIIVEGDVTLVHRRRSLRPSHSSESLYSRKDKEKQGEGAAGEEDEDEDESSVLHRQNPFFQLRPSLALRPDVARDIRDAREREKELRRLRRGLYGSWKKRRHSRASASTSISQADSGSMAEGDYMVF